MQPAAALLLRTAGLVASTSQSTSYTCRRLALQSCQSSLHRPYSAAAEPEESRDVSSIGNEKVRKLAEEITNLTVLECSWLSEILRKKLNMQKPAFGGMPIMPMMGAAPAGPAAAAAAPAAEEKKEQTEFSVKLDGFSPEGKIKVIKEIRAITGLGLKEAKELVEKSPVVVKAGLSKADAEAMQKTLSAAGGKVVLE